MRGHEIPRAISDSTPITVRAILPVGCEHTSALSASHPARRRLYSTEAECSLRDSVADRRLCPLPGSWATLAYMPRSSTPADPRPQALTGPAMWSSAKLTTSTPHGTLSRLNHAACTLSVYASQPGSPPDHATLDSGRWPALTGQGFHLLGRVEGFRHVYPSTWLSPSPSFAWRNNPLIYGRCGSWPNRCWRPTLPQRVLFEPRSPRVVTRHRRTCRIPPSCDKRYVVPGTAEAPGLSMARRPGRRSRR